MEDMNNLRCFMEEILYKSTTIDGSIYEFSIDDLKELRYLASLALVEALCKEHGNIMKDILKGVEENDKA